MDKIDAKHEYCCLTVNTVKFGINQKDEKKKFVSKIVENKPLDLRSSEYFLIE